MSPVEFRKVALSGFPQSWRGGISRVQDGLGQRPRGRPGEVGRPVAKERTGRGMDDQRLGKVRVLGPSGLDEMDDHEYLILDKVDGRAWGGSAITAKGGAHANWSWDD